MISYIYIYSFVAYSSILPSKGETVFGKSFHKNYGGKGANQAVMVARLDGHVSFLTKVGSDSFGDDYISQLLREHVNIDLILRSSESTGIACINVEDSGSNTIIIIPGANSDLSVDDVRTIHTSNINIQRASVLLCQNEIPLLSTLTALNIAKHCGMLSIWNPAPAPTMIESQELISITDIVCPNELELAAMTGLPTNSDEEVQEASKILLGMGCLAVIVTLGSRGACLITNREISFFNAPKVAAKDTVGAGDAFIGISVYSMDNIRFIDSFFCYFIFMFCFEHTVGSLSLNLARHVPIHTSIRRAIGCASLSTERNGAQASYLNLNELPMELRPPIEAEIHQEMTAREAFLMNIK